MWSVEQVEAIAPTPAALSAARPLTTLTKWGGLGADDRAVWGSCRGSGAEPYDTMVDHVGVGFRCTCPSRRHPCKHVLAMLLLWVSGDVPDTTAPPQVASWVEAREASAGRRGPDTTFPPSARDTAASASAPTSDAISDALPEGEREPPPEPDRDRARDERIERMFAGLTELDRWLDDRMRTGLADPALAKYATWDELAARLVDAQAGSLANRIRRLAGLVGASPDWHSDVLAELGLLHLLAQAGRRLGSLPGPLADAVATTVGWQVRQADVLCGVPDTDTWVVAARSDTREDRIEVRRHWLRGSTSGRWALVLSFAAYRQSLDTSLIVGTAVEADLHRYPGPALRALVGTRHGDPIEPARPPAVDVVAACDEVGVLLAAEPWLDRIPFTATAAVAVDGTRFALTDSGGSLPLIAGGRPLATLLAVAGGGTVDVSCEWTPHGVVPLTIHLDDHSIDIGPRADDSFVSAA
ncbi:MAG TPA: SWIM zinc finger family protein [Ilumatobacteraceae bacterium]|nr:SWIM zinc finger family protein [Ilumatobacteraceae bacterium]